MNLHFPEKNASLLRIAWKLTVNKIEQVETFIVWKKHKTIDKGSAKMIVR